MVCPHCHLYTPDNGIKCIHCGVLMSFRDPTLPPAGATRRSNPGLTRLLLLILLGLVALLGYLAYNRQYRSHPVNAFQPGAELDVEAFLEKGKTTIVDFYSNYCPPCRKISPLLTKLEKKRPDLAVINVNINRRGVKGIDWSSPVARQYNLKSIPHFRIYDGEGNLLQEGQEAYVWIMTMLARAGISE